MNLPLHVGNDVIYSVSCICDLGLLLDNELSMKTHKVASVGYFHLRRLKTVQRMLGMQTTASLVTALSSVAWTIAILCLRGCRVEHCAIATCTGCGCETDLCTRSARSRDTFEARVTLAARGTAHHFQTLCSRGPSYLRDLVTLTSDNTSRFRLLCR
jgi:hypothetical protein